MTSSVIRDRPRRDGEFRTRHAFGHASYYVHPLGREHRDDPGAERSKIGGVVIREAYGIEEGALEVVVRPAGIALLEMFRHARLPLIRQHTIQVRPELADDFAA
ncbi:MAG: hypothetical protein V4550_07450 [Gemmatimonadota bacterium]